MVVADVNVAETNLSAANETANVTNMNLTATDEINSDPTQAANVIIAGNNSFEKWNRIHLVAINQSNKIDNFKFWMTPSTPETGISYHTNLQEEPSLVDDSFPGGGPVDTNSTFADQTMPTAEPTNENVGVSGGTGGLDGDGQKADYMVSQNRSTGAAAPGDLLTKTFHIQYDEQ